MTEAGGNGFGHMEHVDVDAGGGVRLAGDLTVPEGARGVVMFAHGSDSSRHSPRNQSVAAALNRAGQGTLLFDLLTPGEGAQRQHVFDIDTLAHRLAGATQWLRGQLPLPVGYFGASTGAAAALRAAALQDAGDTGGAGDRAYVRAVVSRGGRPDLAGSHLALVRAPTLLVVGGADPTVLGLNREAQAELRTESRLEVVPGATHLFEEPGALDAVAALARDWFDQHLHDGEDPGMGDTGTGTGTQR